MAAYGLYTHIQSNKRRSIALLIGLFLLVYVLVFAGALLAEALSVNAPLDYLMRAAAYDFVKAAPFATIGTLIWIWIAYQFHQSMIDAVTGARPVTRQEEPRLYNLLENLCISRGITMPTLRIADDEALNAFATGLNEKQYSITVTRGLMEHLNDAEMEAVLGHELTHIRNGDVRMLVIAVVMAGVISFFGEMMFRLFFQASFYGGFGGRRRSRGDGEGGGRGAAIAIVIAIALIVLVVGAVGGDPLRAVAAARIPRRCRLGGTDQEPGRHDLGAAQDREPRRAQPRHLGGDGDVHRQPARGLFRPFRHPPADRRPHRGAGEICRRARSRSAELAGAGRARAARLRRRNGRSLG